MSKVRVYEVAKDLGLDNREIVVKMAALGIQVRNHMSSLDAADVDRIKRAIEKEKVESVVEERIRPTVVRRRAVPKATAVSAAPMAASVPATSAPVAAPQPPSAPPQQSQYQQQQAQASTEPKLTMQDAMAELGGTVTRAARLEAEAKAAREAAAPRESEPAAVAAPTPEPVLETRQEQHEEVRPSQPPTSGERLSHAHLPPGVVSRGNLTGVSAPRLSAEAVTRIVTEHDARQQARASFVPGDAPRRRELGRAALGPAGRPVQQGRPGKKKLAPPGKKGLPVQQTVLGAQKRVIRIEDRIQVQTLAARMSLKATEVLMKLMQLGMANVHINSTLDADTAKILANEFQWEVENTAKTDDDLVVEARGKFEDVEVDRALRAPIVTVMGHVDHGKTSLLDRIRSADVAAGEAGGITQHIGAYRVDTPRGPVVFLDTPGHEAFTAMRARGASATDIVILVVAADDGVMPQTKEAIAHAKAAKVPIVVAVNKIDKPGARVETIKRELAGEGLQAEDWGGDTVFMEVSAKTGLGVDKLLEAVVLQAEMLELSANSKIPAEGVVLEAYLDRGRGPVANVLVKNGTLNTGDFVVAGQAWGRVRALTDDRNRSVKTAGPSTPVEILGLSEMPSAGDPVFVVTDQKRAQEIGQARRDSVVRSIAPAAKIGLDQLYAMMQTGTVEELRLVIKADVQGSVEAIVKALTDLSTDKVRVNVIHTGVGGITENDIMLASASKAIVVAFGVRPAGNAGAVAKSEGVDVRLYKVIYEAVDEVKKAMAGLLAPTFIEKPLGKAEVRMVMNIPKAGTVAGSYVLEGKILRSGKARLVRDAVMVWEGSIGSLRRIKDDVKEVTMGFECGITLAGFNDLKEHDIIECFELEEVAATLN